MRWRGRIVRYHPPNIHLVLGNIYLLLGGEVLGNIYLMLGGEVLGNIYLVLGGGVLGSVHLMLWKLL